MSLRVLSGDWMLTDAAETFPAGRLDPPTCACGGACLRDILASLPLTAKLNPRFVAWLQGFPLDWLDVGAERLSRATATPSSPKSPTSSAAQS